MANPAQCYFCFESLSASFGGYEPISLPVLEDLWEQYEQAKKLATLEDTDDDPQQIAEDDCEDAESDAVQGGVSNAKVDRPNAIKLPSINRLQGQMSSNSSSASTPSSQSVSSGSTSVTTPSSDIAGQRQQRQSDRRHPLFVTWNTVSKNGNKSLRGCIGTFEAQELSAGLRSYALTSAFDDHRFNPIPESLVPSLSCSLTLLGSFEPCTNAMDWDLGTHGIRISFIQRGRRYGATYLPDVPVEQGWTKEETLESLMRKAGWDGSTGATSSVARRLLRSSRPSSNSGRPWEQVSDFRTVKYQGLKASAGYAEWQEWRNWVLSLDDGREKLLEN
ncbi:AMMECR1 domain-containing protein [Aspergillus ruber CBS 135680]|uniref:AMMECR1 family protein n=1 Tax=Aspergillus ruber (strain CBS 135680) TaxID=1388766 RepID=A0A017SPK1_ASPRC|nr:AMMECR1 family protein [Aspergillus ruber CBS 135680]EYE98185.1 AMMECR1 family protein [Aspergillus ruber CBS 135680]